MIVQYIKKLKIRILIICLALLIFNVSHAIVKVTHFVTSTADAPFAKQTKFSINKNSSKTAEITIQLNKPQQRIEGFGGCFNELGWQALSILKVSDRDEILKNLFDKTSGVKFNICRMPLGANDFSIDWYSYNETPNDFEMNNFSIENDQKTLIPFIKSATKINPDIYIWASPWSPPSWMKYNNHYASVANEPGPFYNGLSASKNSKEGTDMFKVEQNYFEAYALYFEKFIQAYKKEGIKISAVAPQNEFNSTQLFPSCTWTAHGLNTFVGKYLGAKMKQNNVDIWFGTLERANYLLADTLLRDPLSSKYIKAVLFQWAGKDAIREIHKNFPTLRLVQSESECGDGLNDWKYCLYTWSLMKRYFDNGASVYEYCNIALKENGLSRWGWRQNSLISVNEKNATYSFNHEFYLMKHFSHYIQKDARYLNTKGNSKNILAFKNPDGSIVILLANMENNEKVITINLGNYIIKPILKSSSISTIVINQ